jgi:hypothetical protein
MSSPNFKTILRILAEHGAEYIVVGGVAATLQGAAIATFDLDVVHSRVPENLSRVLAALQALDAFYREHPTRRLRPDLSLLASPGHQLLMTHSGPLDLLGTIVGGRGYESLLPHTVELVLEVGLSVRVVDLATLIQLKQELGRAKDLASLAVLRRTLEETERQRGGLGEAGDSC